MKQSILLLCLSIVCISANGQVWVLDNADPNFQTPPFDDSLHFFQNDGSRLLGIGGFNIAQTIGGRRTIAASNDGQTLWINENVTDSLSKIDVEGNILFKIGGAFSAIDEISDGLLYALTTEGTIFGDSIIVLDSEGAFQLGKEYGGVDVVVDESNALVWIVGADVKLLDLNLEHRFTIDPISWSAVSVDYTANGTAWIAVRNPDVLMHVDTTGTIVETVNLSFAPFCVRVDRRSGNVWLSGNDGLYNYDPAQQEIQLIEGDFIGWSLAMDPQNELVWVGTYDDVRSYSLDGELQTVITGFQSVDQKYVAVRGEFSGTSIDEESSTISDSKFQNYPNPFRGSTSIHFSLAEPSQVQLKIYNLLGEELSTLTSGIVPAGEHTVMWNASLYPSGVYVYKLDIDGNVESKLMTLIK